MARKTKAQRMFKLHQKVVMTRSGRYHLKDGRSKYSRTAKITTGIVTGYDRSGNCIQVLRDGYKTAGCYHIRFWKPVQNILYLTFDKLNGYGLWEGKPQFFAVNQAYYTPNNRGTVKLLMNFCTATFERYTGLSWSKYGWKCERCTVGVSFI